MEKRKHRALKKTAVIGKGFLCVWTVLVFGILCACGYNGSFMYPSGTIPPPVGSAENSTLEHTPAQKVSPTPVPAEACEDKINASDSSAQVGEHLGYLVEAAEKSRVKSGAYEYYLDTSQPMLINGFLEFPLYRAEEGPWPEYLGTTGYSFQLNGDYIYIKSDILQEDWPDGTMTRVVDVNTLSVAPVSRNIDIFIPEEGDKVCYTSLDDYIYIADASLSLLKALHIVLPDANTIDQKVGGQYEDLCKGFHITKMDDGWIEFRCFLFWYEGPSVYTGNYRISTNGKHIEKTDEGRFEEQY